MLQTGQDRVDTETRTITFSPIVLWRPKSFDQLNWFCDRFNLNKIY